MRISKKMAKRRMIWGFVWPALLPLSLCGTASAVGIVQDLPPPTTSAAMSPSSSTSPSPTPADPALEGVSPRQDSPSLEGTSPEAGAPDSQEAGMKAVKDVPGESIQSEPRSKQKGGGRRRSRNVKKGERPRVSRSAKSKKAGSKKKKQRARAQGAETGQS